MTDKVKLICKTIKERAEYLRSVCKHSEANALLDLIPIIGPLQEDPKPKFKIGDTVIHVDDGADILYKEHKVVNVLELGYILDNGHSIEMEDQDDWELVKEPESEDLEEVADKICSGLAVVVDGYRYITFSDAVECFKIAAKWQKEIDNKYANIALAEQIEIQQKCYEKGKADMKQQLMRGAIEGFVTAYPYAEGIKIMFGEKNQDIIGKFKVHSKVRIIVLEQEEE